MEPKDFDEREYIEALCTQHRGLPRGGPGCDAYTVDALKKLTGLPSSPRVLDIGCGPGRQTLVLAKQLGVKITAVDFYQPFLDQLQADAAQRGLSSLVQTVHQDMGRLDYVPGSWDLIWSEGAIFIIGFENGLKMWRPWLAEGGYVAVTECTWLKPDPPAETVEYWAGNYPQMKTVEENLSIVAEAGYQVVGHFDLGPDAWWDNYYGPLAGRMNKLAQAGDSDPVLAFARDQAWREMEIYRRFSDWYGYVFYLMRAI
jgi:SAM-dependent methyltransferase